MPSTRSGSRRTARDEEQDVASSSHEEGLNRDFSPTARIPDTAARTPDPQDDVFSRMMRDPQSAAKLKSLILSFQDPDSTPVPRDTAFTPISVQPQQQGLDLDDDAPPQTFQPLPPLGIILMGKSNFKDWRATLEVSLQQIGLYGYLSMETISQSHAALAQRTLSYMAMNCEKAILRKIRANFKTPKAAFDYLVSQYGSNEFSELFDAINRLCYLNFARFSSIQAFEKAFIDITSTADSLDCPIAENMLIVFFIKAITPSNPEIARSMMSLMASPSTTPEEKTLQNMFIELGAQMKTQPKRPNPSILNTQQKGESSSQQRSDSSSRSKPKGQRSESRRPDHPVCDFCKNRHSGICFAKDPKNAPEWYKSKQKEKKQLPAGPTTALTKYVAPSDDEYEDYQRINLIQPVLAIRDAKMGGFWFDTCSASHIVNDIKYFTNIDYSVQDRLAGFDDSTQCSEGRGTVVFDTIYGKIRVNDVYFCPKSTYNLIGLHMFWNTLKGAEITEISGMKCLLWRGESWRLPTTMSKSRLLRILTSPTSHSQRSISAAISRVSTASPVTVCSVAAPRLSPDAQIHVHNAKYGDIAPKTAQEITGLMSYKQPHISADTPTAATAISVAAPTSDTAIIKDIMHNLAKMPPIATLKEWHIKMAHASISAIDLMAKQKLIRISSRDFDPKSCDICAMSKMTKMPSHGHFSPTNQRLDRVHIDMIGGGKSLASEIDDENAEFSGLKGFKYALTITDDFTKFRWTYCLARKDQSASHIKSFINRQLVQLQLVPKYIRADNAKEFKAGHIEDICQKYGVQWEDSSAYCPQQNGMAERANRTIITKARAMMISSKLADKLWPAAILHATDITNITPTTTSPDCVTPFQAFYARKPTVDHLHPFGCLGWAYDHHGGPSKMSPRAYPVAYLGYNSPKQHRVWDGEAVKDIRDVRFNDSQMWTDYMQNRKENAVLAVSHDPAPTLPTLPQAKTADIAYLASTAPAAQSALQPRVLDKDQSAPSPGDIAVPQTITEARKSAQSDQCHDAMKKEIDSLADNVTWDLVPKPYGERVLTGKWVYRIKENGTFKARWCVRGFAQDAEDTYATVVRAITTRILLNLATLKQWEIDQIDVASAFMNSPAGGDIYVEQPTGFKDGSKAVCKLIKCLNGLKTGPLAWYNQLLSTMLDLGFKVAIHDECLFIHQTRQLYVTSHIDDLRVYGAKADIEWFRAQIGAKFAIKQCDTGAYLGMKIDRFPDRFELHQQPYIEDILQRFSAYVKLGRISSPMKASNAKADINAFGVASSTAEPPPNVDTQKYQQIVGKIMYLACQTRPDIQCALAAISRYNTAPNEDAWANLRHLLGYISTTKAYRLVLQPQKQLLKLQCSTDASYATGAKARSISGRIIHLNNAPIAWQTRQQTITATSTAHSELIAAHAGYIQLAPAAELLREITQEPISTPELLVDNEAAISMSKSGVLNNQNRHFLVKFYSLRDAINSDEVKINYVASKEQRADGFTKALQNDNHKRFLGQIPMKTGRKTGLN